MKHIKVSSCCGCELVFSLRKCDVVMALRHAKTRLLFKGQPLVVKVGFEFVPRFFPTHSRAYALGWMVMHFSGWWSCLHQLPYSAVYRL